RESPRIQKESHREWKSRGLRSSKPPCAFGRRDRGESSGRCAPFSAVPCHKPRPDIPFLRISPSSLAQELPSPARSSQRREPRRCPCRAGGRARGGRRARPTPSSGGEARSRVFRRGARRRDARRGREACSERGFRNLRKGWREEYPARRARASREKVPEARS